jgi:CHASE2 domain-containing sensor protein
MRGGGVSKFWAVAAIVVLAAAQALAINYLGRNNYLPEGSEHWTEDWLIHYFSPHLQAPHKDIVLVFVDPESLEKAGLPATLPADRGWMAKLVTAVANAGPLAIGLDFYFFTPIDPVRDELLAAAIRDAKRPVVVAAVDDVFLRTEAQQKFQREFALRVKRPFGHIYLKRSKEILSLGDRATRGVDHGASAQGYASLTSTIAKLPQVEAAFGVHEVPEGTQRIDWLLAPKRGEVFTEISAYEILSPEAGASAPDLQGKIVLIGPDFAGLDRHRVPFTLGRDQAVEYPGVFVHAQALAQILDGRFFFSWSSGQQFLLLFAVGLLGAAAGWAYRSALADIVLGLGGTLLIIALSVPFFTARIPLPTALAILAWGGSLWAGQRVWAWAQRS